MSPKSSALALVLALVLVATACGTGSADLEVTSGEIASQPDGDTREELPEGPIPVEPDGGIGDGAEPLPGAEESEDLGTWHGAEVAVTNCPGMDWKRVQASAFSFSVPADFTENDIQPIDSEIGEWIGGNGIEVTFDYGWYSGSAASAPGAENEPIDYSGIAGEQTIVRSGARPFVSVYFDEVNVDEYDQTNLLSLTAFFTDPNDEIIGRCIVGSIEFE